MFKRSLVIISALLLVACSGVNRSPQEEAINYALVNDATLRQLAEQCSKVSISAKQASWRSARSWWKRNGDLVRAADYGLTYNMMTLTGDRQETGARYAMALTFDIVAEAEQRVEELLDGSDKEETCIDVMADYRDGEMDLRDGSQFYSMLVDLQGQADAKGDDLLLKQAEWSRKQGKKYSRSAYTVERLVKREGCPRAKVRTLKADWPMEVFEAVCRDNSYMLVRCEWGNCKVQD